MNSPHKLTRPMLAWALYDFANSAYATTVLSVIFSVYFANVLVPAQGVSVLGMLVPGESLWGYLIAAVMVTVILLSPALGAYADQWALKRRFLMSWAVLGALCTMGLVIAAPGRLVISTILVFTATLAFEMSLVFYNAFLNDVSTGETAGRASGLGFALGYFGGGLCLGINLLILNRPEMFGLGPNDTNMAVRVGMLLAGAWWLLFSIPCFLWVKDKPLTPTLSPPYTTRGRGRHIVSSFKRLKQTFLDIRAHPALARFLLAYLIYDDGVQTILLMAGIFSAKALGMSAAQLTLCYLMIQFVAFVGAMVCGRLADAWSHKKVIMVGLIAFILVTSWAYFMKSHLEFWILSVIVGLIMGGVQAASRSLYSLMIPAGKATEFFAFFSIVGKAGAVGGPLTFGLVAQFFGLRAGVASLLIFFVVGALILRGVKEPGYEIQSRPSL